MKRSVYAVETVERSFKRRRLQRATISAADARRFILTGELGEATPELRRAREELLRTFERMHFEGKKLEMSAHERATRFRTEDLLSCLQTRRTTFRKLEVALRGLFLKTLLRTECSICMELVHDMEASKLRVMACGGLLCSDCLADTCHFCRQQECQPKKVEKKK